MEQWKTIQDNSKYEISNFGNVRNIKTKKLLKCGDRNGYLCFERYTSVTKYRKMVHRLVAIHFVENPNNYPMINHIDANKHNNRFNNLEWCTNQMNIDHAVRMGMIPRRPVINVETGEIIRSVLALSKHLGWTKSKVKHMLTGRSKNKSGWVYLTPGVYQHNE